MTENPWGKMPHVGKAGEPVNPFKKTAGRGFRQSANS
jgi:hypothetical protein